MKLRIDPFFMALIMLIGMTILQTKAVKNPENDLRDEKQCECIIK